ncbi:redoxin domain-containing protein [Arthrobacter sp.]|uniref:redoxin domain-containing protein n=1 Tax=Arthrobacter sp. TaxID=1667 RepID=UPI003A92D635
MTSMPQSSNQPERGGQRFTALLWAAAGIAVAVALGSIFHVASVERGTAGSPVSGPESSAPVAPGINTAASGLLQLNLLPAPQAVAPDFQLTDQHGQPVTLEQFRGKSVVLSFNDDECEDLCSLLAQDVVAANRDLGSAADDVIFLSINANPFHTTTGDVKDWTDSHGLGGATNWVFATGTDAQLASVADRYHVPITVDAKTHEVVHGSELFFIGPDGKETALGEFGTRSASTGLFAHTMARMAADLLPDGSAIPVAGPTPTGQDPATAGAGASTGQALLNQTAPGITLPRLAGTGQGKLSDSSGKYRVVNFWASTCTACVGEMPELEKAHRQLGDAVAFLGIDVADHAASGRHFAAKARTTYPQLSDQTGSTAGAYRIPGLPFTAIVGPEGKVLVRHPGTFSAEELEYVMQTLDPDLK